MSAVPSHLLCGTRPSRLILYATGDWLAIAGIWLAAAYTPVWLLPVWVLLLAGRFHALGVLLHDAVHLPRGHKTAAPRWIEILSGYPIGTTLDAMRYHHLRHHRHIGLQLDPYLKSWVGRSRVRFWLMSFRYFLLVPLWVLRGFFGAAASYLPGLRNAYAKSFLQDGSGEDLTKSEEVIRCAREERWQSLFFIGVGLLTAGWPERLLTFYLIPLVLAGYFAGIRLLFEHIQERGDDRSVESMMRLTRNHHVGFFGALFLAPHNVGYHLTHHLHPHASFEHLPKLQSWHEQNASVTARGPH